MGRDQSKQIFWLMLSPPESGHSKDLNASCFCVGNHARERKGRQEERQNRVPEGAVYCCGQPDPVPGLEGGGSEKFGAEILRSLQSTPQSSMS